MGLPCAGKTSWIETRPEYKDYCLISADDLKEGHPEYDPDNVTEALHEWSVAEAERHIYEAARMGEDMVIDSGSINNKYTIRIIERLKLSNYEITLVHIKTPYEVCLQRNASRKRKVPATAITDKALKETSQFHKLKTEAAKVIVVDYFTHEHLFIDMDGVLAGQSALPIVDGCIDFVNGEIHKWLPPVIPVINQLKDIITKVGSDHITMYILSAAPNSFSIREKDIWLNTHFPIEPSRRFYVNQGKHKAEMLDNLRRKFKLKKNQVTLVEDNHDTIQKTNARGMRGMHISEFLTFNFYRDEQT